MARVTYKRTLSLKQIKGLLKVINRERQKRKLKPLTTEELKLAFEKSERELEKAVQKLFPQSPTCNLPRTRY